MPNPLYQKRRKRNEFIFDIGLLRKNNSQGTASFIATVLTSSLFKKLINTCQRYSRTFLINILIKSPYGKVLP